MSVLASSFVILAILAAFLVSSLWVSITLLMTGILSISIFTSAPPFTILNNILWNQGNSSTMLALPLFVFMGEILFRSKITMNLFNGLAPLMDSLPGRLIHTNIVGCSLFSAVCGSSAATTMTVGKITLPELQRRNYNEPLTMGSLAGAGTLGFLIPPSTMMLVYGMLANVSIGKLFIGGLIPGAMIAVGLMGYVALRCVINPKLVPRTDTYTFKDRLKALPLIMPVVILIMVVLGSMYAGIATPTESASIGAAGALLFAIGVGGYSWKKFVDAMKGTVKTSAMIMMIVIGAAYLSVAIGYLNIPGKLTAFIAEMGVGPYGLILILTVLYLFLGCVLEGYSMVVMTLPLALPLITNAGFDPLWFGIYLVLMIEIAQLTPPVGFNLFVISSLTGLDVLTVAKYSIPSFVILIAVVALITAFPTLALYLPNMMIH